MTAGRSAHRELRERRLCFCDGIHSPLRAHFPHRIHLMAGRVPQGADRAAVRGEMETVFLDNLRHAAEVLARVRCSENTDMDTYMNVCVCRGRAVWRAVRHKAGRWPRSEGLVRGLTSG